MSERIYAGEDDEVPSTRHKFVMNPVNRYQKQHPRAPSPRREPSPSQVVSPILLSISARSMKMVEEALDPVDILINNILDVALPQ